MEKSVISNIGEETSMYYSFNNSSASSVITITDDEHDDNEKTLEASSSSDVEIISSIQMENPFHIKKKSNKLIKTDNNTTSTPSKYFSPLQYDPTILMKNLMPVAKDFKDVKNVLNSIENNLNLNDDPNELINDLNNQFEKIKLWRGSAGENNHVDNNEIQNDDLDNMENKLSNIIELPANRKKVQINDNIVLSSTSNDKKLSSLSHINKSNTTKQLDKLNKKSKKHSILNFDLNKNKNEINNFLMKNQTNQSEIKQIKNFSEQQKTYLKPILKKPSFELTTKMKLKSSSSSTNMNLLKANSTSDSLSSTTTITNPNDAATQNKLFIKKRQTINAQYTFAPKRRSTNPASASNVQKFSTNSRLTAGGLNSRVSSIVKTTFNSPGMKKINFKKNTDLINKRGPPRKTMSGTEFVKKECPVCFKSFLPTFYEKHVKSHRTNDSIIPGEPADASKNKCKYCDKTFAISKALTNHLSENCIKIPLHEKKKILSLNYTTLQLKSGNHSTESIIESPVNKKKIQKLLPPSERLKPIKKRLTTKAKILDGAHSGVFTPQKQLYCYLCKKKFDNLLQYTDHNMEMHAVASKF